MISLRSLSVIFGLSLALSATAGWAQVSVSDAWVRGTVPGQKATGAFMHLSSTTDQTLVAAASPSAQSVEIHEMTMERGVMKMRGIDRLEIRAGQKVDLQTGGYHLMLLGLHAPLKAGDTVVITLTWQVASGATTTQEVTALVKPLATASGGAHKH